MPSRKPQDITLAILAGGEGSRMGRPKGLLEVRGVPILTYLLDRFRWTGPTLLVTAPGRERPPAHESFTREVTDPAKGQGPLRGVLTALESATTPWVAITTVDMPEVGVDEIHWLADEWERASAVHGLMIRRSGRVEPFPALMHRAAAGVIEARSRGGDRSVQALADTSGFAVVDCPTGWRESVWTNLNRPEEFETWIAGEKLGQAGK